ncbi:MAG: hypothetical protein N2319_13035 [Candidatus Kapabacteria bacterium]|nr:hypothetical protein [Candidatus Kapabacteria bacterium]
MSKGMESKTTGKNSDITQDRIYDLIDVLTGYCAFKIAVYSKDSKGIISEIYHNDNIHEAFYGYHYGMGRGASFILDNKLNTNFGMYINHLGKGDGIYCRQTGESGVSGWFFTENGKNSKSTVIGDNRGLGSAGYFINKNESNQESALVGITQGEGNAISGYVNNAKGHAGSFIIQNPDNGGASLSAYSSGSTTGTALYVKSTGACRAASFESNSNTDQPTVFISSFNQPAIFSTTKGAGLAGIFTDDASRNSTNPVLLAQSKTGITACDIISTSNTNAPAMRITKEGSSSNLALQVNGSIECNGSISKKGGSFVIDHPLDPENKLLSHSFVESPDMKNIYDGIVVLDDKGEATVILPDWFQALNKDFRYQLTCIGGWAQVYIAEEIQNNKFKIAGGKPGMKISWQVTGVRHDKWAEENRIQVEQQKFPNGIANETQAPAIKPTYNSLDLQPTVDFNTLINKNEQSYIESRKNLRPNDK